MFRVFRYTSNLQVRTRKPGKTVRTEGILQDNRVQLKMVGEVFRLVVLLKRCTSNNFLSPRCLFFAIRFVGNRINELPGIISANASNGCTNGTGSRRSHAFSKPHTRCGSLKWKMSKSIGVVEPSEISSSLCSCIDSGLIRKIPCVNNAWQWLGIRGIKQTMYRFYLGK